VRIIIDCTNIRVGGGIQVAISFFRDLNEAQYAGDELIFLVSREVFEKLNPAEFGVHIRILTLEAKHSNNVWRRSWRCKQIETEIKPDRIFVLFGPSYHRSCCPKIVGFARPHYVYRDSPYFQMASFKERLFVDALMVLQEHLFLRNSTALVFETDDARRIMNEKIFGRYGMPSFVVGNTLNNIFLEKELWVKCAKIDRQTGIFNLLCVSANYTHKNIEKLKAVSRYLKQSNPDFKFCLTLTLTENEYKLDDDIHPYFNLIGLVSHNELPDLYSKCDAFILPTLLEVFTTSYLEAMFMQKPILTSALGFARDICGDAAVYFDPMSTESIGRTIENLAADTNLQRTLVTNGKKRLERFTNSKGRTAAYMDIIKGVIDLPPKNRTVLD
jgi:glycosyltransferase involved in cell wall biosynthesis